MQPRVCFWRGGQPQLPAFSELRLWAFSCEPQTNSIIGHYILPPLLVGHYMFPQEGLGPALQEVQVDCSLFGISLQQALHNLLRVSWD